MRALLTSGNGYDLVIGQAGTGKTTLLEAARIGWEEAGFRVIGTAVAARTAADLEAGTGIPSSSLTQLLADVRECGGLTTRHVVVLDEASMVGSRPLDELRSYVDARRSQARLTRRQPPTLLHRRRWGAALALERARQLMSSP